MSTLRQQPVPPRDVVRRPLPPIPRPDAPLVGPDGRVTELWYQYLVALDEIVRALAEIEGGR